MTRGTFRMACISFADIDTELLTRALDEVGHVYVDGIPETFDHAAFLTKRLGPLLPQYDGEIVGSIKAEKKFEQTYHSLNTRKLSPHTECYEWTGVPPRYLALWCLVPNADPGGQTTLADSAGFVASLSEVELEVLRSQSYKFVSTAGLQKMQLGLTAEHTILEERSGRTPVLRFSCQCIAEPDDFSASITKRLQTYYEATKVEINFTARSLLIWDNHRVLHSRNAFVDTRRHLRRVWIGEQ